MSTQFTNRQWRLPNNENKDKQSNYSMDFDSASSDYIDCGSVSLNSNTGTVSAWIKTSYTSDFQIITAIDSQLQLRVLTTGEIRLILYDGSPFAVLNSTSTVNDGNWHNVIFTYSSSGMKIYIDGSLNVSNTDNATPLTTATGNFLIGARSLSGALSKYFNGEIDAVSIYNYALSSSQVTTLYGSSSTGIGNPMSLSPKPVAYYPLGDQDAFNGANYLVPNSSLKDYVFDFANSNIEVNSIGNLFSGITNFSFSGWFNLTSFGGQQVFNILEGSNWKFGINTYQNQLRFNVNPGVAYIANLQNITSTNTWFHYAGVFDGSGASDTDRLKLYINGQPQTVTYNTTTPTSFPTLLSTADIAIGGSLSPFNGMTGKASNIQLWTSSLTPSEIETLYNYGSPIRTLANIPQNSNLQGWWKLDASATYDSSTTTWTIEDSSSNSNTGTSSGMTQANLVQSDLSFTSGYSPYALDFDGANDYIALPTITLTDNWSVSVWMNQTTLRLRAQAVGVSNASGTFWAYAGQTLSGGGDIGKLAYYNGTGYITLSNNRLDDGLWHNWIITYDHSTTTLKCYIDGQENYSDTYNAGTGNTIDRISNTFASNYWLGQLSNISIWNTNLTSAQVTEIYNEGVPSNLNNHSAYSNLVSWWQLGSNSSFNTNWTVLDEKGSNNGTSSNMTEADIVDGVGSYANGLSSGMGGDEVIGDAPYSTANSLSVNMDVEDRVTDTPS